MNKKSFFILCITFTFLVLYSFNAVGSLTDNLTAYYKADTNGAFPDSLNVNNGSISSATYTASGKINGAYNCNGVSGTYINLTDNAFEGTNYTTFASWFKAGTQSTAYAGIISKQDNTGDVSVSGWWLDRDNTANNIYRVCFGLVGIGASCLSNKFTLNLDTWTHLAIVSNGRNITVYINGTQVFTELRTAGTIGTNNQPLRLCDWADSGVTRRQWNGTLDELYFSMNSSKDYSNITALYNNYIGLSYPFVDTSNTFTFNGTSYPNDGESFSQSFINISQNATIYNNSMNCSLILNGIISESKLYSNLINSSYFFNINFSKVLSTPAEYNYSISCKSNITNTTYNSTQQTFWLDIVYPFISTSFVNNSYFYRDNLTAVINITDDFYLNSFNVSVDGVQVAGLSNLTGLSFQYNLSTSILALSNGLHILTITTADGHTAEAIPDYLVSKSLFNDKLTYSYDFKGLKSASINSKSVFDKFETTKLKDRYSIEYTPYDTKQEVFEFPIKTNGNIRIINAPETYLKTWIVFDNKWWDFDMPLEDAEVIKINRVSSNEVLIQVSNVKNKDRLIFNSIGDLNIYSVNYSFYKINMSLIASNGVFGETSNIILNLSKGYNQSYNSASLIYNGVVYPYPAVFDYGSYVLYDVYLTNSQKGNFSYFWNVSLTDYGNQFNFSTVNGSHVVSGLSVNFSLFDVNLSSLNGVLVTANLIGNSLNNNYSTSTGLLNIGNLSTGTYSLILNAPNYVQNSYIFSVSSSSNYSVSVYLQKNDSTYYIPITVRNKFDKGVYVNAKVTIQRYIGNAWVTEQIYTTDFNGQAQGYFVLNTVFYNFIVEIDDVAYFGVLNSDVNKKTIFYSDYLNGLVIEIDPSQTTYGDYVSALGVSLNLSFVNTSVSDGYFLFKWYDGGSITRNGSVHVFNGLNEVCSSSALSSSSSVVCYVNASSRTFFQAVGVIDGYALIGEDGWLGTNIDELSFDWGVMGYFITFIFLVISAFAFAKFPSLSVLFFTFVFGLCALVNLIFNNVVAMGIFIGLGTVSFLLAKIPSNSGMNSG